ncbi:hypothetical protein [Acetobacter sicerae]|uniref:hypothetical protein n=1 Tax=Acetobacter sicerae TaxID=85325 RepID=UPI00156B303F|nr:hypothetical protein [Acetobacter sicerae]NHN92329.1 hypothetical protein [Acetobacter sicerae]
MKITNFVKSAELATRVQSVIANDAGLTAQKRIDWKFLKSTIFFGRCNDSTHRIVEETFRPLFMERSTFSPGSRALQIAVSEGFAPHLEMTASDRFVAGHHRTGAKPAGAMMEQCFNEPGGSG